MPPDGSSGVPSRPRPEANDRTIVEVEVNVEVDVLVYVRAEGQPRMASEVVGMRVRSQIIPIWNKAEGYF